MKLKSANKARLRALAEPSRSDQPRTAGLRSGAIQNTILDVMTSGLSLTVSEIHLAVERLLGRSITRDTVTSYLSVASRNDASPVIRVDRGTYRLLQL